MVVVVGVKSLQEKPADFTLLFNGPNQVNYEVKSITAEEVVTIAVNKDNSTYSKENPYRMVYKFYNWGHVNFKIDFKTIGGSYKVYLNSIGETQYDKNVFTAVGLNAWNADWWANVSSKEGERDTASVLLRRADTDSKPEFCYNCWYYLTVLIDHPEPTAYKI